jgi:hypothetical protein
LLISTVGAGGALDCFTAEPSTAVEHAAESSAAETNAIYASRICKKLPCVAPNSTHGRAVSEGN